MHDLPRLRRYRGRTPGREELRTHTSRLREGTISASLSALMNPALRSVLDAVALWRRGLSSAAAVVDAAVDALVAGVESPTFLRVAGLTRTEADVELAELLPAALEELGVPVVEVTDPGHDVLVAAAMTTPFRNGEQQARALTGDVHRVFGHDCHPLVERLASLDDEFDLLDEGHGSSAEVVEHRVREAVTAVDGAAAEIYEPGERASA